MDKQIPYLLSVVSRTVQRRPCLVYLLILIMVLFSASFLQAQSYRKMRLAISGGYGMRDTGGVEGYGGPTICVEPGYRIADNLLIGFRIEGNLRGRSLSKSGALTIPNTKSISWSPFVTYYFSNKLMRPLIGLGGGITSMAKETMQYHPDFFGPINSYQIGSTKPLFFGRIGVEASHFILSLDYNYISDEQITSVLSLKSSYIAIKFGLYLGGGFN